MVCSTESFDSSFVLNEAGSSSTSPSRLPRMLVEYQPARPSMRALSPGAMTVFIHVWPVLKSFPEIGTPRSFASCCSAGVSTARFGAPLQYGTPSMIAAQAYSMAGEMASSLRSIAFSNCSMVACCGPALMKISVDAHHTTTRRSHLFFALKSRMSWRSCSARSRLVFPFLTFSPLMRVTYRLSNAAGMGLMARRKSAMGSRPRSSRTPAFFAAVWASSGIGSQAPNTMSSSGASGAKSLISGERCSVRLPNRIVAIWVREPMGSDSPRRTHSTPAMNVVATAPRPGVSTPNLPSGLRIATRGVAVDDCTSLFSVGIVGDCLTRAIETGGTRLRASRNRFRGRGDVGEAWFEVLGRADQSFGGEYDAVGAPAPGFIGLNLAASARPLDGLQRAGLIGSDAGDEGDALHHGDPRRDGQQRADRHQHPSAERKAEKCLRSGQQHDPLRTLQNPHLCVDSQSLGPRTRV